MTQPVGSHAVNLTAIRASRKGASFLATPASQQRFAYDYLPPLIPSILNASQVRTKGDSAVLLAAKPPPPTFSWTNPKDVAARVGRAVELHAPPNQRMCGSCWAVSAAAVLSDRHAIATGTPNPQLSPTALLGCDTTATDAQGNRNQQCAGGYPALAGKFFETSGIPPAACNSYQWCTAHGSCNGQNNAGSGTDTLNAIIPACPSGCLAYASPTSATAAPSADPKPRIFRAVPGSTTALVDAPSIQAEIYTNGPVIGTYRVFEDMISRDRTATNKTGWAETGGIYANMQRRGLYPPWSSTNVMGYHAIAIVGWGIERNPIGFSAEVTAALAARGGLKYWIIRNSWGTEWNAGGFWNCAFSYPDLGINTTLLLDAPETTPGQPPFGGATTFQPLLSKADEKAWEAANAPGGAAGGGGGGAAGGGSVPVTTIVAVVVPLVGVALILLVTLLVLKRQGKLRGWRSWRSYAPLQ